jgi:hypothetical protein
MSRQHLETYLNDHLAGAVAALQLLPFLEKMHADTPLGRTLAGLRADVQADREELEAIMKRLGVTASASRKAAAWLAEKGTEIKLKLDDRDAGPLLLLEAVEGLSLGIEGKRGLWRALAAASERNPALGGIDLARLEARAAEQRQRAEALRLDAARAALAAP